MALTPQEKALLESLTAKENEPQAAPEFDSIEKVVRELVRISPLFSAEPDKKNEMLSYLDGLIDPPVAPDAPTD